MLFAGRFEKNRRPRANSFVWLGMPAFLLAGLWLADARADTTEQLEKRMRHVLNQQSLKRIALTVREEDAGQSDAGTRAEMAELGQRLEAICRQSGMAPVSLGADDGLGEFSLTKLPDLDDVEKVLKDSKTEAVLAILWKPIKSGVVLRVILLNDRKVLWNNRTTLTNSATKPQLSAKSKGSTATPAKGGTAFGGTTPNPAGASMLGLNSPASGLGTIGNNGLARGNASGGVAGEIPALNAKILEFAIGKLGTQVGNGECWTLAAEALKYAGAQPPNIYDFGKEVGLDELRPGDILYFDRARFVTPTYWMTLGAPDHVAVVGPVSGRTLLIYHQNFNGDRRVQTMTVDLATHDSGNITGYRAEAGNGAASGKTR